MDHTLRVRGRDRDNLEKPAVSSGSDDEYLEFAAVLDLAIDHLVADRMSDIGVRDTVFPCSRLDLHIVILLLTRIRPVSTSR
jgi:hypothetical protein